MVGFKRSVIQAIGLAALASIFLCCDCSRLGGRANAAQIAREQILFETHCLGCHGGRIQMLARKPPSLDGLFQHKYLPSGAAATDNQVRATIEDGRAGVMPPFRNALSPQAIHDIIAYLHTLKASPPSDPGHAANR